MFYQRLNQLCISNGLRITKFATEVLHASNSTPTAWKKGTSPNSDMVVASAKYFNVSADYLLGLSDVVKPEGGLNAEEVDLLNAWHAAAPILRSAAMNVLRAALPEEGGTSSLSRAAGTPDAL